MIYNIKGHLVGKYGLNPEENQMIIDLQDLSNGIYLIGLYENDQLLESEKLSKGRY